MVYARSPTAETEENPPPRPTRHNSAGPPAGHLAIRPVAREMPSPRGPRHWGHGSPRAGAAPHKAAITDSQRVLPIGRMEAPHVTCDNSGPYLWYERNNSRQV